MVRRVTRPSRAKPRAHETPTCPAPTTPMLGMSGWCLSADLAHRPCGTHEVHLADAMTGPLRADGRLDELREVVVGPAGADHGADVELLECEQARAELALGGDP